MHIPMSAIGISKNCAAMQPHTVGVKVLDIPHFMQDLSYALEAIDENVFTKPGEYLVTFHRTCMDDVSSGMGRRISDPDAYIIREHNGRTDTYLRRQYAARAVAVSAWVHTLIAYKYECSPDPLELAEFEARGVTHVLVSVMAEVGMARYEEALWCVVAD